MLKVSIDKTSEKICFRNQVKWIAFMKIFEYWHDFASVQTLNFRVEFEILWIDKILWRNDMQRKNQHFSSLTDVFIKRFYVEPNQ